MFLGWRRQRWEFFGSLCVTVANGLLPRKDSQSWQTSDFTILVKPPPKWRKKAKSGLERLKAFFRHEPPSDSEPAPCVVRDTPCAIESNQTE